MPLELINSSGWKKNLQNWEITGLFWIGKQPVFDCKIGKIKSLISMNFMFLILLNTILLSNGLFLLV